MREYWGAPNSGRMQLKNQVSFDSQQAAVANTTLGFLIHGFWAGRRSPIFGVWAAPAAPQTFPKRGGLSPPPSGMFFWAAGAAQSPKTDDFRPAQKPCIKNPSVLPSPLFAGFRPLLPARVPCSPALTVVSIVFLLRVVRVNLGSTMPFCFRACRLCGYFLGSCIERGPTDFGRRRE